MGIKLGSTSITLPGCAKVMYGDKLIWQKTVTPSWEDVELTFTGAVQEVTAPAGTYFLKLWGAQGGNSNVGASGGKGGYAEGEITLEAETTLYVYVGGQGEYPGEGTGTGGGGWNGGGGAARVTGDQNYAGCGGGGASDIRIGGTELANRVIIAAGGGGGGGFGTSTKRHGGYGGGTTGGTGVLGGTGGTQTGGGTTGGALGSGATATTSLQGGGGGGGFYGGGRASNNYGGGGGGSSYVAHASISNGSTTGDQRTGNGLVQISKIA